jgi:hypothetical protein
MPLPLSKYLLSLSILLNSSTSYIFLAPLQKSCHSNPPTLGTKTLEVWACSSFALPKEPPPSPKSWKEELGRRGGGHALPWALSRGSSAALAVGRQGGGRGPRRLSGPPGLVGRPGAYAVELAGPHGPNLVLESHLPCTNPPLLPLFLFLFFSDMCTFFM